MQILDRLKHQTDKPDEPLKVSKLIERFFDKKS